MLRGWKFVGLSATIILYVLGILVLSIVNLQAPRNEKRARNSRFVTDVSIPSLALSRLPQFIPPQTDFHRSEMSLLRKTPLQLQWCSELHFVGQKSSPFKLKVMPLETFPGHRINRNNFVIESNQVVLKSPDSVKGDDKLGIVSSTKSDNNEFNEGGGKPIAALASFPGSGNTWLRYLLQQATGILTGSVYKDYGLLKSGFPAESISNTSVLLVKTHEWGSHVWAKFGKAILLVRDPAKAILAEFNRQSGGHVGFASPDRYKRTKGKCKLNGQRGAVNSRVINHRIKSFFSLSFDDRLDEICDNQIARVGTNKLIMGPQLQWARAYHLLRGLGRRCWEDDPRHPQIYQPSGQRGSVAVRDNAQGRNLPTEEASADLRSIHERDEANDRGEAHASLHRTRSQQEA